MLARSRRVRRGVTSVVTLVVVLVAAVALGACGGGGGGSSDVTKTVTNGTIDVNVYDIHFDVRTIKTTPGKLTINLHEKGSDDHTFTVKSENFDIKVNSGHPNASGTLDLKAGSYKFICSTPGHSSVMYGTIEVA